MRQVSIRTKMMLLIVAVAALPMAIAVVGVAIRGRTIRTELAGHVIFAATGLRAQNLQMSLVAEADKLLAVLDHQPLVYESLGKIRKQLDPQELEKLDQEWLHLGEDKGPLAEVLAHPISVQLRLIKEDDRRIGEILVTDRFGQLVAATNRTSDFYQADEEWWQLAWDKGKGRIYVPPIGYDASSGVWSIDLCMPIRDPKTAEVVGVVKAVIDVSQWFGDLSQLVGSLSLSAMLLRSDGTVIYRSGMTVPTIEEKPNVPIPESIDPHRPDGWGVSQNGFIYATVKLTMPTLISGEPVESPDRVLVIYLPSSQAMKELNKLTAMILGAGLVVILILFFFGMFLVEHGIVRRVRKLAAGSRSVAEGDLTHRIMPNWPRRRLVGRDEIDELAEDFDEMIEKMQRSYDALKTANDLKSNFIRIAGHEFRTPISYILGMTRLLKDSTDADKLLHGVQLMGAKAKRLDDITQAMFKLMPEAPYAETMRYSEVNLRELIEEIYIDSFPFLEKRSQKLVMDVSRELPTVTADRNKLRDAIDNLVSNAIKFTPDGGTITVRAYRKDGSVLIEVTDQGPGIPPADLPYIFEPFFSTRDVFRHSTGEGEYQKRGIGLGLTVAKHYILLHGGKLDVVTGPSGSTFTIELPIKPLKDSSKFEGRGS